MRVPPGAARIISGEMSSPTTSAARSASATVERPVPHATSIARSTGATPTSACTRASERGWWYGRPRL
jgi:hypothetical protein